MKYLILSSVFLFFSLKIYSQHKLLNKFDTNGMETSILYQESPLINIQKYQNRPINTYNFYQAYKDLFQNNFKKRYAPLDSLKNKTKQSYFNNTIPLAIIHSNYETIKKSALKDNVVTQNQEGYLIRKNNTIPIFKKHTLTIASALRMKHKGLQTSFILSATNIYNTTNNKIVSVKIDFDDNNGYRNVPIDTKIDIQYTNVGTKKITTQLVFEDNTTSTCKSTIHISYSNTNLQTIFNRTVNTFTASITPDLSVYGESTSYPAEGEYEIFMSTEPGAVLDKPLIIIDGFDPTDSRPITGYTDTTTGNYVSGIYDLLNFDNNGTPSNLGDLVRAEGFDLVILNFPEYTRSADNTLVDGGSDYIERNAMLLVDLINNLNTQKIGTEKNVIIGPSMGGLISRYALNYMENQSIDHDTRLWLSFDSPHLGANVPIGFQHQFNFLAYGLNDFYFIGNQNVVELQVIVDGMLKSSAARQMLVDQFEPHLINGSSVDFDSSKKLPIRHPFSSIFYDRLNNLTTSGFPENLRKIAIINGSGNNLRYQNIYGNDLLPGNSILNTNFNVATGTDLTLSVNLTPYAGNEVNVSHVYLDFAWYIPAFDVTSNAYSKAFSYTNGVDASSGGLFDIGSITANLDATGTVGNFLAALQTDYFNFIPSVSGMALEVTNNEIDWFHNPTNLVTARSINNNTPFDAWYMPTNNEPHVTVTQPNFVFAWDEIVLSVLHANTFSLDNSYKLLKNPINNNVIKIKSKNTTSKKIEINIYSITGQKLKTANINNPSNQTINIPIHLNAGMYLLELNDGETLYKTKILIN